MNKDVQLALVIGAGVIFLAWGVGYSSQINSLVSGGAKDYVGVVQGLEPSNVAGSSAASFNG